MKEVVLLFNKAEKNYFINMIAAIIGLACAITGIMLKFRNLPFSSYFSPVRLHEITGYLIIAIVVVHLLMHVTWIKNVTKILFNQKKTAIGLAASILLPIGICVAIVSTSPAGGSGHFPGGGKQFNSQNGNESGYGDRGFRNRGFGGRGFDNGGSDSFNDGSSTAQQGEEF